LYQRKSTLALALHQVQMYEATYTSPAELLLRT